MNRRSRHRIAAIQINLLQMRTAVCNLDDAAIGYLAHSGENEDSERTTAGYFGHPGICNLVVRTKYILYFL